MFIKTIGTDSLRYYLLFPEKEKKKEREILVPIFSVPAFKWLTHALIISCLKYAASSSFI